MSAEGCFKTRPGTNPSIDVFQSEQYPKYLNYMSLLSFENVPNVMQLLKMGKNIDKELLAFKINPFQSVAENSWYYGENTWHRHTMF